MPLLHQCFICWYFEINLSQAVGMWKKSTVSSTIYAENINIITHHTFISLSNKRQQDFILELQYYYSYSSYLIQFDVKHSKSF